MRCAPLLVLAVAACTAPLPIESGSAVVLRNGIDGGGGTDGGENDGGRLGPDAGVYLLTLDAGPFPPTPNHPSAALYVPTNFDPRGPVAVVAFFHGFNACVASAIADAPTSCDPDAGTGARNPSHLVSQFAAAGKNALLVVPQLAFDLPSSNPGALSADAGFANLLVEALAQLGVSSSDVRPVIIVAHSGGFQAAAAVLTRGGVPISETYLLDALFGSGPTFEGWLMDGGSKRLVDVYSLAGGTVSNSQSMANNLAAWLGASAPASLVDDRDAGAPISDAGLSMPIVFKLTADAVSEVPLWFGRLVSTSRLP